MKVIFRSGIDGEADLVQTTEMISRDAFRHILFVDSKQYQRLREEPA